jgi:hypothetical protein
VANSIKLTFAGDADSLAKASKKGEQSLGDFGAAADKSGKQLSDNAKQSADLGTKMGHLGSAVSGAGDAFDAIGGSLDAVNQLQQAGAERAAKLARAVNDVQQAQEDLNQAFRDGSQAAIDSDQAAVDLQQANLDAAQATRDYATAVKEHGKNSAEAQQAALDLKQAQVDIKQANEDSAQATRDAAQATIDAKGAQLDLNDANREAHPPELQKWADDLQMVTPLISAVVGVVGLVTAAQWLWNASLFASPVTWIVLAIAALVAIIVIIATKTTWFQDIWNASWGGIKAAAQWAWDGIKAGASAVWSYLTKVWDYFLGIPGKIKATFASLGEAMFAPFRWAFNKVSDAWNGTVGHLSWSVPGWVPGIGGNSISAPKLPHYHQGGIVPGGLGSEVLAVLQAGERVTPMGGGGGHAEEVVTLQTGDSEFDRLILASIRRSVGLGGNDPVRVLRGNRG